MRQGDGVYVNGVKVILKGTNRHTFWPTLGRASSPAWRMDILLMKEMNNNAVRMSHYPPGMFFLDLCHDSTRAILDSSNIFMSTEFLHALYGGGGAGLSDYWNLMGSGPRRAGGFIWSSWTKGPSGTTGAVPSTTTGNNAPDGVLGSFLEKEASFHTIREIWFPVQLADPDYYATTFPANFDGAVRVVNRYDFTNLRGCRFTWQLVKHPPPVPRAPRRR